MRCYFKESHYDGTGLYFVTTRPDLEDFGGLPILKETVTVKGEMLSDRIYTSVTVNSRKLDHTTFAIPERILAYPKIYRNPVAMDDGSYVQYDQDEDRYYVELPEEKPLVALIEGLSNIDPKLRPALYTDPETGNYELVNF